jgi:hypothetical protein
MIPEGASTAAPADSKAHTSKTVLQQFVTPMHGRDSYGKDVADAYSAVLKKGGIAEGRHVSEIAVVQFWCVFSGFEAGSGAS